MLSVRRGLCTQRQRSSQPEGDSPAGTDSDSHSTSRCPREVGGGESTKARKTKGEKESKKYRVLVGRNGTRTRGREGDGGWRGWMLPREHPGAEDLPRPVRPWETALWASFLSQSRGFDRQEPQWPEENAPRYCAAL